MYIMETWMIEHAVGRRDKGEDDFCGQVLVFIFLFSVALLKFN